MSRFLTVAEVNQRVNRAFESAAASCGLTVDEAWGRIASAWNEAIAQDEREEAEGQEVRKP